MAKLHSTIYLTFDCENFINKKAIFALQRILEVMQKHETKGLFFLTGHIAEKLKDKPVVVDLLKGHQIGYHTSSHSVRPTLFEYTDIKNYDLAKKISLERETSRINPLTGQCEGNGGIHVLHDLFPNKQIVAFRAPGFCWSPPHLEALKELGICFDFSTFLSKIPVKYNGITFVPATTLMDEISFQSYPTLFRRLIQSRMAVLIFHPSSFANSYEWDSIYFNGNPKLLQHINSRKPNETNILFRAFELFLKQFKVFQRSGLVTFTPPLKESQTELSVSTERIMKSYRESINWAQERFAYKPQFLLDHFKHFFTQHP